MQTLRVLHVAPELAPFTGEGENAEVAEALCRGLCSLKPRIRVTAATLLDPERDPQEHGIARRLEPVEVQTGGGPIEVAIWEGLLPNGGVEALVADCESAADPVEALARLALDLLHRQDRWPHVVHTWDTAPHAALVAKREARALGRPEPAVVLSLSDPKAPLGDPLRGALAAADRVVVSSPSAARELLEAREDLADALGERSELRGVVHGIDEVRFSPSRDSHLSRPYDVATRAEKVDLKAELQREVGLPPRKARPLVGSVGPFDLLDKETAAALAGAGAQLAFLIDPDRDVDSASELIELAKRHPTSIAAREVASSSARAGGMHRLLAGADLWLLPRAPAARGHLELSCLPYGTIPIAPRARAFADLLVDFDPTTATGSGFLFQRDGDDLALAVRRAGRAFGTWGWGQLVERAMRMDVSWRTAASRYADIYREALRQTAAGGQKVDRVVA